MARRSTGEGSIIQTENGRWAAVIELPRGADGKRNRRWRRARTKTEAQALLRQMRDELHQSGSIADANRTVDQAVEEYRALRASSQGLSHGTLDQDEGPLKLIETGLGRQRLASLTVADCDRFLRRAAAGELGRSLGDRYLRRLRRTLINVVQNEMRIGSVSRNVANLAMTPSSPKNLERHASTHHRRAAGPPRRGHRWPADHHRPLRPQRATAGRGPGASGGSTSTWTRAS